MRGMQGLSSMVALAAGLLAACQPAAESPQQAETRMSTESAAMKTIVDSLDKEFATHFNMAHADVVAAMYTEQGHLMAPNMAAAGGGGAKRAGPGGGGGEKPAAPALGTVGDRQRADRDRAGHLRLHLHASRHDGADDRQGEVPGPLAPGGRALAPGG